ncbi:hypothetical protein HPB50_027194 [Hyalomma asiaticum]|uniref:Uncharacterized protein n=1 Tax=Hyalomma asiaticum TaxID=266040 RepID=A0ACB7T4R1_HYAAI|nr:hypothetical protein HPB50_027194 [Hyalomma asiaticum]
MTLSPDPRGRADVLPNLESAVAASERTFDEDDPEIDKVCRYSGSVVASSDGITYTAGLDLLFSFKAIVVVGVVIYLLNLPSMLEDSAEGRAGGDVNGAGCAGGDPGKCFGFRRELLGSMDLSRDPCEDFYGYVRTQDMIAEKMTNIGLSARKRSAEALTTAEQVSLAYLACTDTYRNKTDSLSTINDLIFQKMLLFNQSKSLTKNFPIAIKEALATLAMKWNVPLFFQIDFSPHSKLPTETMLVIDYSLSLLNWMNHKRKVLTPEATALLIAQYLYSNFSAQSGIDDRRTLALIRLDEELTTQWVFILLSLRGRPHFRRISLVELRREVAGGEEWLEAIGRSGLGILSTGHNVLTSERLLAAVDDVLSAHTGARELLLRDFVALHVVRQLAPFISYRFVDALLNDPSRATSAAARSYVVSECISAVSRLLPGRSLINLVFHDAAVSQERRGHALNHLSRIWNLTTKLLLGENENRTGKHVGEGHPLFSLSVAWQNGLDDVPGVMEDDLKPFNVDRPFIELYLSSVAALRSRKRNGTARSLSFARRIGKGTGLLKLRNVPPRWDDTAWDESVYVPTTALFEPFLVLDNDPFTLGALGQFLSRSLWEVILDAPKRSAALGKALALADVCRAGESQLDEPDSSSTGRDLLSTHLPSIVGLETAYAAYRRSRENFTGSQQGGDGEAEFTTAQLFYIGSCFHSCASVAHVAENGFPTRASERSLCNVPAMLSQGFGPAFRCPPGSEMMKLARHESSTCIDPDAWPPRRIAGAGEFDGIRLYRAEGRNTTVRARSSLHA